MGFGSPWKLSKVKKNNKNPKFNIASLKVGGGKNTHLILIFNHFYRKYCHVFSSVLFPVALHVKVFL